jgi:hypothetical protein
MRNASYVVYARRERAAGISMGGGDVDHESLVTMFLGLHPPR